MLPSDWHKKKDIHVELPGDPGPCSFCGKAWGPAGVILYGPDGVAICDDCIAGAVTALELKLGRDWYRSRPR